MAVTVRRLELRVREGTLPWDETTPCPTVDLVLDGRDLQGWLAPHLPREHRDTGGYLGHPVGADLRALLLGRWSGDGDEAFEGRTALLGCTCTVIGCSPLVARITLTDETVTWSEFSRYRGPHFDYEPLELQFERSAYEAAISDYEARVSR